MTTVSRTFNKSLYALAAIKDGLEAFQGLGTLDLNTGDSDWTVTFAEVDTDFSPEELASEFANYVLAQTIERRH